MKEYYRWTEANLAVAEAALDALNNNQRLPLVGRNAKTGQLEPNKQKTTKWANEVQVFTDGMVGFPRMPESLLDSLGVSAEERQAFLDGYNPTIEEFDPAWIPEVEEDLL